MNKIINNEHDDKINKDIYSSNGNLISFWHDNEKNEKKIIIITMKLRNY